MQTKDVLLLVVGVALGYLASRMNYGSRTATAVGDLATGVVDDVKEVAVDTVKMAECQKKLIETTSTMKFASAEAEAMFRKNFLAECMASK
jgi:uncharacterized membrane protein